jgi:diaminopimelate epimerase
MAQPDGLHVVKSHAYGNDFLLVPQDDVHGLNLPGLARRLCDRHRGVGADGMILYHALGDRLQMRLYNADGSSSEISGNGVRCLAAYAVARRLIAGLGQDGREVLIETDAGIKTLELIDNLHDRWTFRASMGTPSGIKQVHLDAAGEQVQAVVLSVGNPQCILLESLDQVRLHRLGPALECHEAFPNRTNVAFVDVETPQHLRILIWERGVGPTAASGTGACGSAVAAITYGGADRAVDVESPGGVQRVEWREDGLYLTGWAEILFEGRWVAESE